MLPLLNGELSAVLTIFGFENNWNDLVVSTLCVSGSDNEEHNVDIVMWYRWGDLQIFINGSFIFRQVHSGTAENVWL